MERELASTEELAAEAGMLAARLRPKEGGATLVTLSGELGAGKTAFVQALARALGVTEAVTSPTFVLEKIYALPVGGSFARLAHIDAYRLEGAHALAPLGFAELMKDSGTLVALEWPEKVQAELPAADVAIRLAVAGEGRVIAYG
ncbi:MAG TPA: tRNA (adenosine(37)-N6)-threonylcarbamoyltransferase complex ATPase subunit type 1 TsaE [Candidatus Paceibacterota bacterium]|nr:tRNA (adenosine(37)-N6)-threonylcarbamoyltransferase complex ATPase subunit type 1 TsaE [Candidatus Paceibacterota bacterium]